MKQNYWTAAAARRRKKQRKSNKKKLLQNILLTRVHNVSCVLFHECFFSCAFCVMFVFALSLCRLETRILHIEQICWRFFDVSERTFAMCYSTYIVHPKPPLPIFFFTRFFLSSILSLPLIRCSFLSLPNVISIPANLRVKLFQ